jgi:DNA-binding NarL/FixJ family response regulator
MAEIIRVLIADDHPVVREGLRGLIEIQRGAGRAEGVDRNSA